MANESRASGDEDDRGAGGKLVRRRRRRNAEDITPYRRPEEAEERRRWWLSGLVASAGRLLSRVFRSGGGDGESDADSSEGDGSIGDNPEDHIIKDQNLGFEPAASNSRTKLVIEQMLQKENFTSSECDRLIELIQSRVIASSIPNIQGDEISNGPRNVIFDNDVSYRGSFLEKLRTPEISNKAVMEAKRWVEEKRSAISSKTVHEASSLKSAILVTDEPDKGSPVDMAKLYMHTLPPSSSPARTSGFRSSSLRTCSNKFETSSATLNPAVSSLQDLKRKYDCTGPSDDFNTTQRMRLETSEDAPISRALRQSEPSMKTNEHEYSQSLGHTDGKIQEVLPTSRSAVLEVTAKFPMETVERTGPSDTDDVAKTSLPLKNGVCTETDIVESEVQVEVVSSLKEVIVSEKFQGLEEIPVSNKSIDIAEPLETDFHPILVDQKGLIEDFMNAEPISMVPENDNPTLPGKDSGETIDVTKSDAYNLGEGSRPPKVENEHNNSQPDSYPASVVHTDSGVSHDLVSEKETRSVKVSATVGGAFSIPSSSSAGGSGAVANATSSIKENRSPTSNGMTVPNDAARTSSDGNPNKRQKRTVRLRQSPRKAASSTSPSQAPPSTSPGRGKKTAATRGRRRGRGK